MWSERTFNQMRLCVAKPVLRHLFGCKSAFLEPCPNGIAPLPVFVEVSGCKLCRRGGLFFHCGVNFVPKTEAGFQQIFDFCSRIADRRAIRLGSRQRVTLRA